MWDAWIETGKTIAPAISPTRPKRPGGTRAAVTPSDSGPSPQYAIERQEIVEGFAVSTAPSGSVARDGSSELPVEATAGMGFDPTLDKAFSQSLDAEILAAIRLVVPVYPGHPFSRLDAINVKSGARDQNLPEICRTAAAAKALVAAAAARVTAAARATAAAAQVPGAEAPVAAAQALATVAATAMDTAEAMARAAARNDRFVSVSAGAVCDSNEPR